MWLMLQQDQPEEYVIATGKTSSVRDFVNFCCAHLGIDIIWDGEGESEKGYDRKTNKLIIEVNKDYFRPAEVDVMVGSAKKAKTRLGWEAKTNVETLASIMIDFDKDRIV